MALRNPNERDALLTRGQIQDQEKLALDSPVEPESPDADSKLIRHHKHAKGTSWVTTASLIVANMLGAGVLGIPAAVKGMGWIISGVLLALITIASIYGGLALGLLRGDNHEIKTYGDLAAHCAARYSARAAIWWRYGVQCIAYTYIVGACTIYLLTMKISLMEMLQTCAQPEITNNCNTTTTCTMSGCTTMGVVSLSDLSWLLITMGVAYPLIHIQTLKDAGLLSYIGVGSIAIVNIIIIVRAVVDAASHPHTAPCNNNNNNGDDGSDTRFIDIINGLTVLAFAYGGHVLMIDIQSEMHEPTHFNKSIWSSQIFMCINYAIVGFLGFYAYGNNVKSPITLNMPSDGVSIFANALLFIHVTIAYLINSTVISTVICRYFWPAFHTSFSPRAKALRWGCVASLVMTTCFFIAVLVPFFSDLMNIYSSIGIFTLSFAVPSCLLVLYKYPTFNHWSFIDIVIAIIAVVGAGLGVYSASKDIANKWDYCDYKIGF